MDAGKRGHWQELLQLVEVADDLPTRKARKWHADKLYFLHQYIGITTKAMVGKRAWEAGVFYVDLFAGPGVCTLQESGERIPGSPLIAAHAPKPFTRILLIEKNARAAAACRVRMDSTPAATAYSMFEGDCNVRVSEVAHEIPERALTLAFVDPNGLDIDFESIRVLSSRGCVDLLVLFADRMDVGRNLARYEERGSKLDRFLGPDSEWRDRLRDSMDTSQFLDELRSIYQSQLRRHLGYGYSDHVTMEGPRGPLYRVIYASKDETGLTFWHKITARDRSGQRKLF